MHSSVVFWLLSFGASVLIWYPNISFLELRYFLKFVVVTDEKLFKISSLDQHKDGEYDDNY